MTDTATRNMILVDRLCPTCNSDILSVRDTEGGDTVWTCDNGHVDRFRTNPNEPVKVQTVTDTDLESAYSSIRSLELTLENMRRSRGAEARITRAATRRELSTEWNDLTPQQRAGYPAWRDQRMTIEWH